MKDYEMKVIHQSGDRRLPSIMKKLLPIFAKGI
jgi:hypothetical protein